MKTNNAETIKKPFYKTGPGATIIAAVILGIATIIGVILTPKNTSESLQDEVLERTGGESPLYQLSPDIYEGLIGTQQYQQKTDIKSRVAELESAERQKQFRTLHQQAA